MLSVRWACSIILVALATHHLGVGATAVAPDIPARSIEDSQLAVGISGVSRTSTFVMSTAQLACSVCTAALSYAPLADPWQTDLAGRTTFAIATAIACSAASSRSPAQHQVCVSTLTQNAPFIFFQQRSTASTSAAICSAIEFLPGPCRQGA